jgi:hypothetical protein
VIPGASRLTKGGVVRTFRIYVLDDYGRVNHRPSISKLRQLRKSQQSSRHRRTVLHSSARVATWSCTSKASLASVCVGTRRERSERTHDEAAGAAGRAPTDSTMDEDRIACDRGFSRDHNNNGFGLLDRQKPVGLGANIRQSDSAAIRRVHRVDAREAQNVTVEYQYLGGQYDRVPAPSSAPCFKRPGTAR